MIRRRAAQRRGIPRDRRARVTELAGYLGLDKSTMSGLVDRAAGCRHAAAARRTAASSTSS